MSARSIAAPARAAAAAVIARSDPASPVHPPSLFQLSRAVHPPSLTQISGVRISRAAGGRAAGGLVSCSTATMDRRRRQRGRAAGILDRAAGGLVCGSSASRSMSRPWVIWRSVEVRVPDHGEHLADDGEHVAHHVVHFPDDLADRRTLSRIRPTPHVRVGRRSRDLSGGSPHPHPPAVLGSREAPAAREDQAAQEAQERQEQEDQAAQEQLWLRQEQAAPPGAEAAAWPTPRPDRRTRRPTPGSAQCFQRFGKAGISRRRPRGS